MRRKAVDLSAIVSGSIYGWSVSASDQKADELLRDAAVWLHINPQTLMTQGNISPLAQFAGPLLWTGLNQAGISGLYLAPAWGAGELWARGAYTDNEDIVQYDFAPYVSNDDEYNALVKNSQELGRFMGGDIIPAATGIGPDFFLATRNYRDYSGVYCMLEVPKQYWSLLPAQNSPGATVTPNIEDAEFRQVAGLSAEQTAALARVGIIPEFLRQEKLAYMPPSGWAATSEVRGVDGQLRRWVYRYVGDSHRPVLNWSDPSATARQILNGSVIRQVGIFGNAFSGYSVLPFIGLEGQPEGASQGKAHALALEASNNLARQIRSYAGWSWLRDELPLSFLADFLENGPDFVLDSVGSPYAETALLTGDAKQLRASLDEALQVGLDFKRLVHKGAYHHTTPVGLVAEALGLKEENNLSAEYKAEIARGHNLLVFFKAMQPGLLMLSGQDLVGAMPLSWQSLSDTLDKGDKRMVTLGAYALRGDPGSVMVNSRGLPEAKILYGAVDEQLYAPDSFLNNVGKLLRLRDALGLARSKLAGRFKVKGKALIGLVLQREDKKSWLICLSNFSRNASKENLNPIQIAGLTQAMRQGQAKVVYGNLSVQNLNENSLEFIIPGWEGVVIQVEE